MDNQLNRSSVKSLTRAKIWCFAIGQFGWSLLAALISSYVTNFYVPDEVTQQAGQPLFIPQGAIFLGITILGLITGIGRVFDAVTDPLIGSLSDRCPPKDGRRLPWPRPSGPRPGPEISCIRGRKRGSRERPFQSRR